MAELQPVNVLKLDFEEGNPQKSMSIPRIGWVARFCRLTVEDVRAYRTAKGVHVVVRVREPLHPLIAVLIQSLMGSDYAREAYNAVRVLNLMASPDKYDAVAHDCWNVLYYKKLVGGRVASEERFDPELTEALRRELIERARRRAEKEAEEGAEK